MEVKENNNIKVVFIPPPLYNSNYAWKRTPVKAWYFIIFSFILAIVDHEATLKTNVRESASVSLLLHELRPMV